MYTSHLLSLALLYVSCVVAAPRTPQGQHLPIKRRSPAGRTVEEWGKWAVAHRQRMSAKYGSAEATKRSTGTALFFGSLAIGTPPTSYDVILDTGSSEPFQISYGSGKASGYLGSDIVQMAGFSVTNQTFGVCDTVSSGLLTSPVSGLLGLAFQTIASSGAIPFWQALVEGDAWDSPLMAFHLTRFLNVSTAEVLEYGGSLSMGFANQSLYTGDIEYHDLAATESYWILALTSLATNGESISIPSGTDSYAAIDTGTTLVGGPSKYLSQFYAQIPGATAGTGNFQGYYTYPCDTTVNPTMSFGGKDWPISEADFRLTQLSQDTCLGAFFELTTGSSAPSWIVGDTFLKNVYSVFRYNPASVGFAELSDLALAYNGADTPVPSATIGSAAATVIATGTTSVPTGTSGSSGSVRLESSSRFLIVAVGGALLVTMSRSLWL
ncbi:hypothetical protein H0H93_000917 [Arthromyces matolae]|nr:hypothetical protein H0H93_000917 [Arthromyces matolae]